VRLRSVPAVLAAFVLLTAGCSGDKGDEGKKTTETTRFPPTRPVNNKELNEGQGACGLLTSGEVSTAVGLPASSGSGVETSTGESSCRWVLRVAGTQFVGLVQSVLGVEAYEERIRQLGAGVEPLPGVGDRALLLNDTAYVFKGSKMLIVQVSTSQPLAARKQAATRLAQSAVGRA
jgi:hypothetical protein